MPGSRAWEPWDYIVFFFDWDWSSPDQDWSNPYDWGEWIRMIVKAAESSTK